MGSRSVGILVLVLALLATGVGFFLQRSASEELTVMRSLTPLDLAAPPVGSNAWLEGTVALDETASTAPVSGLQAAWWRTETRLEWEEYDSCERRVNDRCQGGWEGRSEARGENAATGRLLVRDASGAMLQVALAPGAEIADLEPTSVDRQPMPAEDSSGGGMSIGIGGRNGERRNTQLVTREWALFEGTQLLVMGRVAVQGDLVIVAPIEGVPTASSSTFAERSASVARRASIFGWIFYLGLGGLVLAAVMLVGGVLQRREPTPDAWPGADSDPGP